MAKTIRLEIVTAEKIIFSDDVDMVVAPGTEGALGILPKHAPLLTALQVGELRLKQGGEETHIAVGGGFMQVLPDKVTILAETAERAEEIDVTRAEAARQRARQRLDATRGEADVAKAEAALRRSLIRLKVAEKKKKGK